MNIVSLVGRTTKEIEVKMTSSGKPYARFNLAVPRAKKGESDFPTIIAWNQSAEYLGQYAPKGTLIEVTGSLTTSTYESNGKKNYSTEVLASRVSILAKPQGNSASPTNESVNGDIDIDVDDLPFV